MSKVVRPVPVGIHHQRRQAGQQDEAAETKVNRDFPSGFPIVARAAHPDHQEGRDQRQFVEGVEEEQVGRHKGAHGPGRDQQTAAVIKRFATRFNRPHQHRRQGDDDW